MVIFLSVQNWLGNFVNGHFEDYLCEIILQFCGPAVYGEVSICSSGGNFLKGRTQV